MSAEPRPPRGWHVGSPAGVPIHVSATWPLLASVIVLFFGPRIAEALPGIGMARAHLVAFAYALLLMVSVLAHEAAHAAAARAAGARVGHIVIDVFGGHTVYEAGALTPGRSALIAVAGPVANGVIALAALPVTRVTDGVPFLLVTALVATNLAVGAFNLIPAHPLDGGQVLSSLTWAVSGRRELGMIVSGWAGRVLVVALVLVLLGEPLLSGDRPSLLVLLWVAMAGAMMWSAAGQSVRTGTRIAAFERIDVDALLTPVVLVDATASMADVARHVGARPAPPVVLVADGADVGLLGVDPASVDPRTRAGDYVVRAAPGWLVDVDATPPLADIVDHMHEHQVSLVVLRREGRLAGAVTAARATEALARVGIRS